MYSGMVVRVWFILAASVAAMTDDEACNLAGSRFARMQSICIEQVCTNVSLVRGSVDVLPHPDGQPLRCAEARTIAAEFLTQFRSPEPASVSLDGVLASLGSEILPIFRLIQLGGLGDALSMGRFLTAVTQLAAFSWPSWISVGVRAVTKSEEFAEWKHIVTSLLTPYQIGPRSRNDAIIFYFDFAALLGMHVLHWEDVRSLGLVVRFSRASYRPLGNRERYIADSRDQAGNTAVLLEVSSAVDVLSQPLLKSPAREVLTVVKVLSTWAEIRHTTAFGLVAHQIFTALCPILPHLLASLNHRGSNPRIEIVRFGLLLLHACRPHVTKSLVRSAGEVLASIANPASVGYVLPSKDRIKWFLENDYVPWSIGLQSITDPIRRSFGCIDVLSVLTTTIAELVPLANAGNSFKLMGPVRSGGLAFGRALGILIRYRGSLRSLNLAPSLVGMLLPRHRHQVKSLGDLAIAVYGNENVGAEMLEGFYFTTVGLTEAIGFGGFELYSDGEWMTLFRPDLFPTVT